MSPAWMKGLSLLELAELAAAWQSDELGHVLVPEINREMTRRHELECARAGDTAQSRCEL